MNALPGELSESTRINLRIGLNIQRIQLVGRPQCSDEKILFSALNLTSSDSATDRQFGKNGGTNKSAPNGAQFVEFWRGEA
jgi:hypothetical protein